MANIKFGTSGWRAVIAEDFTSANLLKVTHAVAAHVKNNHEYGFHGEEYRRWLKNCGCFPKMPLVVVGYDTRYMSEDFARETAEGLASEGITALLSKTEAPTPAVAWTVIKNRAVGGITITASHNPPHYNGFKWTPFWGGPAIPSITDDIEINLFNLNQTTAAKRMPLQTAIDNGLVELRDFQSDYLKQLASLLDLKKIKQAGLKIAVDSVYGTARSYLRPFLEAAGVSAFGLHEERDVLFGGSSPDTSEDNLKELRGLVLQKKLDIGLACDGDADRFGIIDSEGTWISPNEALGLLVEHLAKNKGMSGKVCRSLMTSHFADAVAKLYNLEVRETAVGFKYIGDLLRTGQYLIGGEESGGLSIMGHVPEKDGILACLLIAEMTAFEKKPLAEIRRRLHKKAGDFINARFNFRVENGMNMSEINSRLKHKPPLDLAGSSVWRIDHTDGFKFIMRDGSWLGLRPSGTEPVVRIYVEARTRLKFDALVKESRKILGAYK